MPVVREPGRDARNEEGGAMTTGQRELAEAGAGMLACRDHGMEAAAIRAALDDVDALTAEVALLRKDGKALKIAAQTMERMAAEITVLKSAGRVHGYLDELDADDKPCDCHSCTLWRERFGQEAGR